MVIITSPSWVFTCLYVFSHKLWHLSNPTLLFQEFIAQNYCTVYVQEMKVTTLMHIYVNLFSYFHQKIIFSNCQISKHCNCRSYISPWKQFSSFHKISLCVRTSVGVCAFFSSFTLKIRRLLFWFPLFGHLCWLKGKKFVYNYYT